MQKGWKQTWRDVLFEHFEIENTRFLESLLPKGCSLDHYEGKYYLGLVSMKMTNVRHKMFPSFVWFASYNELNVRTYIRYNAKPGVLFLTLDVDSLLSVLGARVLYGLPYRYRNFTLHSNSVTSSKWGSKEFSCEYEPYGEELVHEEGSFAFWATERYFFANKHLGESFMGIISHKPWRLSSARVKSDNLEILKPYPIVAQHKEVLFCSSLDVATSELVRL